MHRSLHFPPCALRNSSWVLVFLAKSFETRWQKKSVPQRGSVWVGDEQRAR